MFTEKMKRSPDERYKQTKRANRNLTDTFLTLIEVFPNQKRISVYKHTVKKALCDSF
jgi:hypothetical protein